MFVDGKPLLHDSVSFSPRTKMTREGYLVADVRAARAGIYHYRGDEVGIPDKQVVRVWRPVETVFDKKTLASFTSLDVTDDHPPEMVDSKNWSRYSKGHTGEDIARDGEYVRVSLIVRDQDSIDKVRSGKKGLSFGYTCDIEPRSGRTPEGHEFDAVQTNLIGNHLAIVDCGRAGAECIIGDSSSLNTGDQAMPDNIKLRTIVSDGYQVETTDAGAVAIENLQKKLNDANSANLKLVADHAEAIKAHEAVAKALQDKLSEANGQIGAKDGEIKTLTDKLANIDVDSLAAQRNEVLTGAKLLGLTDTESKGKTNDEVVKLAVTKALGDQKVRDKDNSYLRAAFDMMVDSKSKDGGIHLQSATVDHDPLAGAFRQIGIPAGDQNSAESEHKKMVDSMTSAWQNPGPAPSLNGASR